MNPGSRALAVQRWIVGWLCAALVALPLAGCKTAPRTGPEPGTVQLAAIVIDEQRLAGSGEPTAVRVLRNGAWQVARPGMPLQIGDRIHVGRSATAVIRWPGLGEAYLRPDSAATIGSLDDFFGTVFVKVRGIFAVQTRLVASAAKGTAFHVRGGADGAMELTVYEGAVEMSSRAAAWPAVTLRPGETTLGGARSPRPAPASEAEMRSTREWVERIERLVPQPAARTGSGAGSAQWLVPIAAALGAILIARSGSKETAPPAGTGNDTRRAPNQADRPTPRPPSPVAPGGLTPGGANPNQSQRLACAATTLGWQSVPGATAYAVTVEHGTGSPQVWRTVLQRTTGATSMPFDPGDKGWGFRFSVSAQQPGGSATGGPVYFHFGCPVIR
jgi:hypothetical protein